MSVWQFTGGYALYLGVTIVCYKHFGYVPKFYDYLAYYLFPLLLWAEDYWNLSPAQKLFWRDEVPWKEGALASVEKVEKKPRRSSAAA